MVTESIFGRGKQYTIESGDLAVTVADLGATVTSLRWRGKECVLGYDSPEGYLQGDAYLGAVVGRYANRIGGAAFSLNGTRWQLAANEGRNQLHGGPDSYDKREWQAGVGKDSVSFSLLSPDGDNGYPGTLRVQVAYRAEGDCLRLDFWGESDADTVFAPTSHMYFCLGEGSVLDASLRIPAERVVEVGPGLIPTGRLLPAEGDFDFRTLRPVARDYDHCFVLTGEHACRLEQGHVALDVYTDFPGLQVYTGAFLPAPFRRNQGLALEPEFFPDSPNQPAFPDTTLRKGERFHKYMEFRFSARQTAAEA